MQQTPLRQGKANNSSVPECCQPRTPWKLPLTRETSNDPSSPMVPLYKQTSPFDHKWLRYFTRRKSWSLHCSQGHRKKEKKTDKLAIAKCNNSFEGKRGFLQTSTYTGKGTQGKPHEDTALKLRAEENVEIWDKCILDTGNRMCKNMT